MLNADGLTVRRQSPKPTHSAIGRFLTKILVQHGDMDSPCWIWQGCVTRNGYGQFRVDGRRGATSRRSAHCFAYEYFIGHIPKGHEVHHLCYTRRCVNPLHLKAVTHRANLTDSAANTFAARNARKTHCAHGHEFSGNNLYLYQERRACRACNARRQREYQRKRSNGKR